MQGFDASYLILFGGMLLIMWLFMIRPQAKQAKKTAGGIIIPDTAKEKPQRGTVIAAGPGKKDEPVTVKSGDTVLYGKYAGTEIQIDGEDYLIMRESDILAIV
jgi:chaperonin GroES